MSWESTVPTASALIALLQLQPHPKEGGFFRESYRSGERTSHLSLSGK